jgi:hypothetical protein
MAQRSDHEERDALDRLSRVQGDASLRAAVLALLMNSDSERAQEAWMYETAPLVIADDVRADVQCLTGATRLPCLEALLDRVRELPKAQRRALLQATRRVVAAQGPVQPLDRLHWLLMRRKLGDTPPVAALPVAQNDMAALPPQMLQNVAFVTAFLSRLVPGQDAKRGLLWYRAVMGRFMPQSSIPPCDPPDGDRMVHALQEVESLPWMLRPVLVRAWVEAALLTAQRARLGAPAADALRLVAGLLDSPLPPELARHYRELEW